MFILYLSSSHFLLKLEKCQFFYFLDSVYAKLRFVDMLVLIKIVICPYTEVLTIFGMKRGSAL